MVTSLVAYGRADMYLGLVFVAEGFMRRVLVSLRFIPEEVLSAILLLSERGRTHR